MGEPEAFKILKEGILKLNDKTFEIIKHPSGFCDGCYFLDKSCPTLATKVCCTGGVVFKEIKNKI